MVDVELQPEPVAADRCDDRRTLLLRAQQISGRIARIERLDNEPDPSGFGLLGGPGEVDGIERERRVVSETRRRHPGHDMDQLAIERRR